MEKNRRGSIPLYVDYQGKRVVSGILGPDKVFRKSVELRQKLVVMDAYGIDEENFRELNAFGCKVIELRERDTGRKYLIDFDTFKAKAVPRQIGKFGLRYYLPLRYWRTLEPAVGDTP
ncbi:hypothetical protein [Carboxydothermus hydrogenoformans]|uniref:hypothetical protein n=1 Tax=Carboxydothermus hydrogenoformans TaxID=129958 RepID=UPI0002ED8094|nr:hypothetical protein [Carboxydothermus hydrogenoformans]